MTRDGQPLFGTRAFAFQTRLHAACDDLDLHGAFLAGSYRQVGPRLRGECVAPDRHRLPRWLRRPPAPLIGRPWGLQVADGRGAGHPQHIAFTTRAQFVAQPRVASQFIVTRHPAVRDLCSPQIEHLHTLVLSRAILHLLWHVAYCAPLWVSCPVAREGQTEVEQGMIPAQHVPHADADLTVVDLPAVAT